MCYTMKCLPGPGGAMDQDWYIATGVQAVYQAIEERRALEEQKQSRAQEAKARGARR